MMHMALSSNVDVCASAAANELAAKVDSGELMLGEQARFTFTFVAGKWVYELSPWVRAELIQHNQDGSLSLLWTVNDPDGKGRGRGVMPHYHPVAEHLTLVSGRFARLKWTDGTHRSSAWLLPGDSVTIPAGVTHEAWYWGGCTVAIDYEPGMKVRYKGKGW